MENNDAPKTPHSLSLEQAVLSGIMSDGEGWDAVCNVIQEVDFFSQRHRLAQTLG